MIDAFRIFDREGKGWITPPQLLTGLAQLNISASTEDIFIFMKRFDRFDSGRLKYSDFCEAFIPLDPVNANKLCKRIPRKT